MPPGSGRSRGWLRARASAEDRGKGAKIGARRALGSIVGFLGGFMRVSEGWWGLSADFRMRLGIPWRPLGCGLETPGAHRRRKSERAKTIVCVRFCQMSASWGRRGCFLGTSWEPLGASWGHLVRSWGVLGAILGCLRLPGAIWRHLGGFEVLREALRDRGRQGLFRLPMRTRGSGPKPPPGQLDICIHTYMHACLHTSVHARMHAHIHAYIHTCMHAYVHAKNKARMRISSRPSSCLILLPSAASWGFLGALGDLQRAPECSGDCPESGSFFQDAKM